MGGPSATDHVLPMSYQHLYNVASEWADLVPGSTPDEVRNLLSTARALYSHSWFHYEFLTVSGLISLQALDAAFRQILYPKANPKAPFHNLVERAKADGYVKAEMADIALTGVELRNDFSHPMDQALFTPAMAGSIVETTHRLVNVIVAAAAQNKRNIRE